MKKDGKEMLQVWRRSCPVACVEDSGGASFPPAAHVKDHGGAGGYGPKDITDHC